MTKFQAEIEGRLIYAYLMFKLRRKGIKIMASNIQGLVLQDVIDLLAGKPVDVTVNVQEGDVTIPVIGLVAASGAINLHLQKK